MDAMNTAFQLARNGIAVLPLHGASQDGTYCHCARGSSCPSKGKHPIYRDWASAPFPTGEQIAEWFAAHPTANLGGRTGAISGNIFVLDLDEGGRENFAPIVQQHGGTMPETLVTRTGSGGQHLFYRAPAGVTIPNSVSRLAPHVDVRGENGQVVLPPSRTRGDYVIEHSAGIADAPSWLVELILSAGSGDEVEAPAAAPKRPQTGEEAAKERNFLSKIAERLDAKRNKPWEPGDAWDITCFTEACHLLELANSEWTALTYEDALRFYTEHAPRDDRWDDRAKCWKQAFDRTGGRAKDGPTPLATLDQMAGGAAGRAPQAPSTPQATQDGPPRVEGADVAAADSAVVAQFCNEALAERFHYTDESGWFHWDGRVWAQTPQVVIEEQFRLWCSNKVAQAAAAGNDALVKFYSARLTTGKLEGIPKRCRGAMIVSMGAFDQHPDLLNVRNGVVNLATGTLEPHNPGYRLTRIAEVEYHPGVTHPDWDKALQAIPEPVADWLQLRVGQAATGHPTWDDILPILQGGGENGKSTVLAAIQHALGSHAGVISEKVLMGRPSDHPTEMTDLRGMRMAIIEETSQDGILNIKRLKDILGTATIRARRIRENTVEWRPTHSLFLTTNYAPKVSETDHGTWRRLALVRFPFRYVKEGEDLTNENDRRGDMGLRPRLMEGQQGQHQAILAWIVAGAQRWYASGRAAAALPPQVVADTAAWRAETDRVHGFLEERIEFDPAGKVLSTDLYAEFTSYLNAVGSPHWAENTFVARLREHPLLRERSVVKRRTSALSDVSRPGSAYQEHAAGQQAMVWFGMKFRPRETSNVVDMGQWAGTAR